MRRNDAIFRPARCEPALRPGTGSGVSLVELLVVIFVMSFAVIGALTMFEGATRLANSQIHLSRMQSTQRIAQQEMVRMISMAGIGGLPTGIEPQVAVDNGLATYGVFPTGLALAVTKNVPDETKIGDLDVPVIAGTDILTLRGVYSTPVYHIEPPIDLTLTAGQVVITVREDVHKDVNITQDLDLLREALRVSPSAFTTEPEAFIVYDRFKPGAFAVMQFLPTSSDLTKKPVDDDVSISLSLGAGAEHATAYGNMVLATTLVQGAAGEEIPVPGTGHTIQLPKTIGAIGLLEEYRFIVRREREIPGDDASRLTANLSRVRFFPGTEVITREGVVDIAPDIIDLQIALGVDHNDLPDGIIQEIGLAVDDDEVLYNFPGEDDGLTTITTSDWANPGARLLFVRLSTVVQSDRPDRNFPGARVDLVEDHNYFTDTTYSEFNQGNYEKLRKRLLQTTIELRNLP